MKHFFFLFFIPIYIIFADSVTLYNDSIYELIAIVRGANGKILAQKTLAPGEQSVWSTDQIATQLDIDYNYSSSYSPFTVQWKCSYEGDFSVCYNIASGAIVVATKCPGPHYCKPKPKKEENQKNQKSNIKNKNN